MICASQLIGFGHYAPDNRIENKQIEDKLNLEAGWIERRTGIRARRWVGAGESLIDLAEKAGEAALKQSGLARNEIALTLLATSTPDRLLPPTAPLLAHRLGLIQSGAIDLAGACSGFIYALALAEGFVRIQGKSVLIVAANILSRRINLADPSSAILFADAAGATVLAPSHDRSKGLLGVNLLSDGSGYDFITIGAGGSQKPFSPDIPLHEYKIQLGDGQVIFTQAINMMVNCANQALEKAEIKASEIHRFIPHQANARIFTKVAEKLKMKDKIVSTIGEYGNSSAASIPFSLSLSHQGNPFFSGEKILLTAAGAGLSGGAVVLGL